MLTDNTITADAVLAKAGKITAGLTDETMKQSLKATSEGVKNKIDAHKAALGAAAAEAVRKTDEKNAALKAKVEPLLGSLVRAGGEEFNVWAARVKGALETITDDNNNDISDVITAFTTPLSLSNMLGTVNDNRSHIVFKPLMDMIFELLKKERTGRLTKMIPWFDSKLASLPPRTKSTDPSFKDKINALPEIDALRGLPMLSPLSKNIIDSTIEKAAQALYTYKRSLTGVIGLGQSVGIKPIEKLEGELRGWTGHIDNGSMPVVSTPSPPPPLPTNPLTNPLTNPPTTTFDSLVVALDTKVAVDVANVTVTGAYIDRQFAAVSAANGAGIKEIKDAINILEKSKDVLALSPSPDYAEALKVYTSFKEFKDVGALFPKTLAAVETKIAEITVKIDETSTNLPTMFQTTNSADMTLINGTPTAIEGFEKELNYAEAITAIERIAAIMSKEEYVKSAPTNTKALVTKIMDGMGRLVELNKLKTTLDEADGQNVSATTIDAKIEAKGKRVAAYKAMLAIYNDPKYATITTEVFRNEMKGIIDEKISEVTAALKIDQDQKIIFDDLEAAINSNDKAQMDTVLNKYTFDNLGWHPILKDKWRELEAKKESLSAPPKVETEEAKRLADEAKAAKAAKAAKKAKLTATNDKISKGKKDLEALVKTFRLENGQPPATKLSDKSPEANFAAAVVAVTGSKQLTISELDKITANPVYIKLTDLIAIPYNESKGAATATAIKAKAQEMLEELNNYKTTTVGGARTTRRRDRKTGQIKRKLQSKTPRKARKPLVRT